MPGPYGCTICFPGAVPGTPLPAGATDRQRIAALCDHVMQVHHGSGVDAWNVARLVYPIAARAWEQEISAPADRSGWNWQRTPGGWYSGPERPDQAATGSETSVGGADG